MSKTKRELAEMEQQRNELQVLLMAATQKAGGEIQLSTGLVGAMIDAAQVGASLHIATVDHAVIVTVSSSKEATQ